jgi:hypothetical protein
LFNGAFDVPPAPPPVAVTVGPKPEFDPFNPNAG